MVVDALNTIFVIISAFKSQVGKKVANVLLRSSNIYFSDRHSQSLFLAGRYSLNDKIVMALYGFRGLVVVNEF